MFLRRKNFLLHFLHVHCFLGCTVSVSYRQSSRANWPLSPTCQDEQTTQLRRQPLTLAIQNSVQQLLSTLSSNPGDLAAHVDEKTQKAIVKVSELGQPRQLLPLAYLRGLSRFLAAGALTPMKGTFISLKLPYCKCQLLWLPTTRTTMELRT